LVILAASIAYSAISGDWPSLHPDWKKVIAGGALVVLSGFILRWQLSREERDDLLQQMFGVPKRLTRRSATDDRTRR
jgi:hypothetical protein